MHLRPGRRAPIWAGAVALGLAAAPGLLVPGPAHAAATAELEFEDVIVGVGTDGVTSPIWLHTEQDTLADVVVTVDTSGAGSTTVQPSAGSTGCESGPALIRCSYPSVRTFSPVAMLAVAPTSRAQSGDTGALTISVTANGLAKQTVTRKIEVADVVDLAAEPAEQEVTGRPGGTVALPGGVRNTSSRPVDGVILWGSSGTDNVAYARKGDNCLYTDELVACRFDQTLQPRTRYDLRTPVTLAVRSDAPAEFRFGTGYFWDTTADGQRWFDSVRRHGGRKGSGPALTLTERPGVSARSQTDPRQSNNHIDFQARITGHNAADQIAVGGTFRGPVGATVRAKLGLRNGGPARVDTRRGEIAGSTGIHVVTPSNATVTALPENACAPLKADGTPDYDRPALGAREVFCWGPQELEVGATYHWDFSFRVDAATGTGGSVAVLKDDHCCDRDDPNGWSVLDRDPANNTAPLVVALPAPGGTGTGGTGTGGAGTGGAGNGDTGGEGGGGLPLTGPATAGYAAAGVALLALGVAGVLLARRRRTRFTA